MFPAVAIFATVMPAIVTKYKESKLRHCHTDQPQTRELNPVQINLGGAS